MEVPFKHIHSIESIQRRATRLICGSDKPYSERLTELNWLSLELRRKYLCLLQLYKIIHGYSDVDYSAYVDLTGPTRTRSNHDLKIRPKAARTNYFKFSFFNRYVNDWNSLPNSVMSASSLSSFKTLLLNYLCKLIGLLVFVHIVKLYIRYTILNCFNFYFWRAVFIWEFSFPLLLFFTYCTFVYIFSFVHW